MQKVIPDNSAIIQYIAILQKFDIIDMTMTKKIKNAKEIKKVKKVGFFYSATYSGNAATSRAVQS